MINTMADFFKDAPDGVDVASILRQYARLRDAYDIEHWQLPLPLWTKRPFDDDGARAWAKIGRLAGMEDDEKPICLYLHVPFCASKCGFCDSYSFRLANRVEQHVDAYVEMLCHELDSWSKAGWLGKRPVSTVHLGGGTPTFINTAAFSCLLSHIQSGFNITEETEWALESTVESLTPSMTEFLHSHGFRRLHVGVQCLEDNPRRLIGRRRTASEVLNCIQTHLGLGWVVSVDLICGLPGQTLQGWLADIQSLIDVGTDGFSLYELLIYPQNYQWAKKHGLTERQHLPNYCLFQAGAQRLSQYGFIKNIFNHWANKRDRNIYFTYPSRGEDLVAIGTIASGNLGAYHYRHHFYANYKKTENFDHLGLLGGLMETAIEQQIKPLGSAILSGSIPPDLSACFDQLKANDHNLLSWWLAHGLVERNQQGGYCLTDNGSWLAGNMIEELG